LLQVLRTRIDGYFGAWLRRRQGLDGDPVELRRPRIYILPTRLGLAYATMLFAMLLGGLNYNNNLGLALTFLLVALGLVTMHHCHGTLRGLRLRLLAAEPAFAGDDVHFRWLLENDAPLPRPAIELQADGTRAPTVVDVPALGSAAAELGLPAPRRGLVPLERCTIATSHPLGLFRAWAVLHLEHVAIAWPKPASHDRAPPLVATDTGGAQTGAAGDEDFAGLRPYQTGDSLRRIAWKAYARGQGLHTKQYAGTDVVSHVFDWDSLPGLETETRLAQLCRWILDAHDRGEAFGLRLPGTTIDINLGPAHRDRCLNALAVFGPESADA
jgi:uncharacterized protein (DUF58 family)